MAKSRQMLHQILVFNRIGNDERVLNLVADGDRIERDGLSFRIASRSGTFTEPERRFCFDRAEKPAIIGLKVDLELLFFKRAGRADDFEAALAKFEPPKRRESVSALQKLQN